MATMWNSWRSFQYSTVDVYRVTNCNYRNPQFWLIYFDRPLPLCYAFKQYFLTDFLHWCECEAINVVCLSGTCIIVDYCKLQKSTHKSLDLVRWSVHFIRILINLSSKITKSNEIRSIVTENKEHKKTNTHNSQITSITVNNYITETELGATGIL